MGFYKAEKSMNSKESVGPAKMIVSSADAVESFALAQDTPKTSPYPFIHDGKGRFVTMLEVLKPASQGAVDIFDDHGQTAAVATLGFGAYGIPELLQTFRAGPPSAPLEMVAEEVKTLSVNAHIHQSGLVRVQGKSAFCGQLAEEIESSVGFGLIAAQNHEIVRVTDHLIACGHHCDIDRVEVEIGEQRAYDRSLGAAFLRGPQGQILQYILFEEGPDQVQHAPISYIAADIGHERLVRYVVEVGLYVGIHHMSVSGAEEFFHFPQCVLTSAARAESITVAYKNILKDGLDYHTQRSLNDSVSHTGNSQRTLLLAAGLINVDPADRSRPIASRAERFGKPRNLSREVFLEVLNTLMIRAGAASISLDRRPSGGECRGSLDLIDQTEPYASPHPLNEGLQHAFRPHMAFHPLPIPGAGFSRLCSPFGHYRRFRFLQCGLHSSTFLRPFAPRALPRFFALTDALTPARLALRTLFKGNEHQPFSGQVSLVHTARTSMHSVTNHLAHPVIAFVLPTQRNRLPDPGLRTATPMPFRGLANLWQTSCSRPCSGLDFTINEVARRYARPNRVRPYPTDCIFTSGCSPPHLAVTQLPLAIGNGHFPEEDFHLPDRACSQAHSFRRKPESSFFSVG